ncbi:MAG TPA: histidine triad nucleotide-binding protein [Synergistales bacterium]|nr:histidine triad nucleotide-binding protein [Synergistales bacterium]HPK43348.1 histidine triad nucleotide-binding protein [Synergistales bacterium]
MDHECPFCRIVQGRGKADIVYSDKDVVVIRDIHPKAPVHLLVIPKRHVGSADDIEDPSIWSTVMDAAVKVARELDLREGGYRLVVNCGADAGQTVNHLHVHLLAGRVFGWPPG